MLGRRRGTEEFDAVFRELLPRAKRVGYRILGDVGEAEDAAVEAFSRAAVRWNRIGSLPTSSRDAWIMKVTSNVAYDEVRRRMRRTRPLPLGPTPDGQEPIDVIDVRDSVVAHLARLPTRQREVLTLRYIGGFSEAEIAQSLGVSAGTVKTSASRGLGTLKAKMGTEPEFDAFH